MIRNVPEEPNEKLWSDTTDLLAEKLASILNIDPSEAKPMIDRCHRGGNSTYYKGKNKIRPIYAAMMRWTDCEEIVKNARGQSDIFVDYKYGPLTTIRRNQALKMRKDLKASGEIVKGFVKFPAVLIGLRPGAEKMEVIHNFSDDDVSTYKRD